MGVNHGKRLVRKIIATLLSGLILNIIKKELKVLEFGAVQFCNLVMRRDSGESNYFGRVMND